VPEIDFLLGQTTKQETQLAEGAALFKVLGKYLVKNCRAGAESCFLFELESRAYSTEKNGLEIIISGTCGIVVYIHIFIILTSCVSINSIPFPQYKDSIF